VKHTLLVVDLNQNLNQRQILVKLSNIDNYANQPSDRRLSAKLVPTFAARGVSRGQRGGSLQP
jgi:hypothetical protein